MFGHVIYSNYNNIRQRPFCMPLGSVSTYVGCVLPTYGRVLPLVLLGVERHYGCTATDCCAVYCTAVAAVLRAGRRHPDIPVYLFIFAAQNIKLEN